MPTPFSREELRSYARARRAEYESVLKKIVEIPSVSVEPERKADTRRAAEYAVSLLKSFGAEARLYETKGHPIVHGRFDRNPKYPTVTVYNPLDVQPAEGPDWTSAPFEFVKDGDRYLGRGTTDDKGPAITALFGARYAFEQKVPVNIHFLWELEEEIGSPSFETAIRGNAGDFATDSIVVSDTVWVSRSRPACPAGLRGLQGFRFELQTGETDSTPARRAARRATRSRSSARSSPSAWTERPAASRSRASTPTSSPRPRRSSRTSRSAASRSRTSRRTTSSARCASTTRSRS
jgi:acetylornithine deacetylase/succinyl-diaminopimelate desuccinylase-like protein